MEASGKTSHSLQIQGADLKLKSFATVICISLLNLLAMAGNGFAFSFSGIDINSKFGERFSAELDVLLEEEGSFQIQIGDEEDYRRLELDRPNLVDGLQIEQSEDASGTRKTIRITSSTPLFYPSFHLVVRGTFKGGTLLENYLVTVDFQQSLALNVKDSKKRKPVDTEPREMVDLLKGGEAGIDSAPGTVEEDVEASQENFEVASGPPESAAKPKPEEKPFRVNAPQWMAKPAAPMVGPREEDYSFPGAKWVSPLFPPEEEELPSDFQEPEEEIPVQVAKNEPAEETPEPEETASVLDSEEESGSISGSHYGPLAKGENLLSISKKLNLEAFDTRQIAVALWMDNPESFIYGNMNGLKQGTQLNLENLEKRLKDLKPRLAEDTLQSQWDEWKTIRKKLASALNEEIDPLTQEIQLPSELEEEKGLIFEMLRGWKTSWEAGDLQAHLAHFSDRTQEGDITGIQSLKRRMFARHPSVRLQVHQAYLILKAGQPVISFGQDFSSEKMESFGRKDIGVAWEGGGWKIVNEKFKVKEYMEKARLAPTVSLISTQEIFSEAEPVPVSYVIHASSHLDYSTATQATNELRKKGFNAYSSPVYISPRKKIYRVYVGRYSDSELAEELARELKKISISRLAIPVRYPFSFLLGEYESEADAEAQVRSLRSSGLSPLLFISSNQDFLQPRFRVFLGAFAKKRDAARIAGELKSLNLSANLVTP